MSDLAEHLGIDARSFEGVSPLQVFLAGIEYERIVQIADDPEAARFEFDVLLINLDRLMAMLRGKGWVVLSDVPACGWARLYAWRCEFLDAMEDHDGV